MSEALCFISSSPTKAQVVEPRCSGQRSGVPGDCFRKASWDLGFPSFPVSPPDSEVGDFVPP